MKYWALYEEGNPDPIDIQPRDVEMKEGDFRLANGYLRKYKVEEVTLVPTKLLDNKSVSIVCNKAC